jgi:hypothetical protein
MKRTSQYADATFANDQAGEIAQDLEVIRECRDYDFPTLCILKKPQPCRSLENRTVRKPIQPGVPIMQSHVEALKVEHDLPSELIKPSWSFRSHRSHRLLSAKGPVDPETVSC